jgi:hypothetical protein
VNKKRNFWEWTIGVSVLSVLFIAALATTSARLTSAKIDHWTTALNLKAATAASTPTGTDSIDGVIELDGNINDVAKGPAQFVMRLKIPTLSPPAVAIDELTVGVVTIAHPVEPPPPPPPPFPLCANKGSASNTRHTNTNVGLTKRFFILPPRLIGIEPRSSSGECCVYFSWGRDCA